MLFEKDTNLVDMLQYICNIQFYFILLFRGHSQNSSICNKTYPIIESV